MNPNTRVHHLLRSLLRRQGRLSIVQIGANVGAHADDPIYPFLLSVDDDAAVDLLLVEPVRHLFKRLVDNYRGFPNARFENAAVAERSGRRSFYRLAEGAPLDGRPDWLNQLGSLLPDRAAAVPGHRRFLAEHAVVEEVRCVTFAELLAKHGVAEIDLLQIDAEGYDWRIIRTIDFGTVRPKAVNYERVLLPDEDEADCRALLRSCGYALYDYSESNDTLAILAGVGVGPPWKLRVRKQR